MRTLTPDLCVIGAGSAGLSVAAGAAQLGVATVLVEEGVMGGDCLNYGCVPSKALLAAAHEAARPRQSAAFGLNAPVPGIERERVAAHVKSVIAAIAPHDSVERFEGLGVTVIKARARFVDAKTVEAGDTRIVARRFVLAVGSSAAVPPIQGLDRVPYLTNETVFDHIAAIRDLIVLGGGPIGVELAQAFARLGAKVSLVEMAQILPRDDAEAVALLRVALVADGVALHERTTATEVAPEAGRVRVTCRDAEGKTVSLEAGHLLIAVGRRPRVDGMGLDAAGIEAGPKGIRIDDGLRTTNRRVYAIGDCTGGPAFTHVAGAQAALVIRSALFRLPVKFDRRVLPWVTYADPELAQIGLTEAQAKAGGQAAGGDPVVIRVPYGENDRARAERAESGFLKLVADRRGHILGVTIVGARAGELLAPWCLAMSRRLKLSALAGLMLPYPTLSELSKRAAGQFYAPKLFSGPVRKLVRFLRWFG